VRLGLIIGLIAVLVSLVVFPGIDRDISRLFGGPKGFPWDLSWPVLALENIAYSGARLLGLALLIGGVVAMIHRAPFLNLPAKAWLFLFLGLLLGPGLIANVVFKDNWGRARPRETVEFGGTAQHTPPFIISTACEKNCSFISGDASFGFFLPCFAYVASQRRSRRVFWAGMTAGCIFGLARIVGGAHFLSDVAFAAAFMLLMGALLHGVMYGWKETKKHWRWWLSGTK